MAEYIMETATSAGSSLAEALFGKSTRSDEVWQEVRFDSAAAYLELRRGEVVLEAMVSRTCEEGFPTATCSNTKQQLCLHHRGGSGMPPLQPTVSMSGSS